MKWNKRGIILAEMLVGLSLFSLMLALYLPAFLQAYQRYQHTQQTTQRWEQLYQLSQLSAETADRLDTAIQISPLPIASFDVTTTHYRLVMQDGSECYVQLEE